MARHRRASLAAVFLLDNLAKLLHRDLVAAHLDERAHDGAHHVAQKAVGGDGKHPLVALALPSRMRDAAVVGLHVGVKFGKRGEVGVSHHALGGTVHQVEVEAAGTVPAQRVAKRRLHVVGEVLVGARRGVETRVLVVAHGKHAVDGDILAQQLVEAVNELVAVGNGLLHIHVGIRRRGVHPSVGASGSHHLDGLSQQGGKRLFERFLHRVVVWLNLPPVKRCPVICQLDKVPQGSVLCLLFIVYSL